MRHSGRLDNLHLAAQHALPLDRQRNRRRRNAFLPVAKDGVGQNRFCRQADLVPAIG